MSKTMTEQEKIKEITEFVKEMIEDSRDEIKECQSDGHMNTYGCGVYVGRLDAFRFIENILNDKDPWEHL